MVCSWRRDSARAPLPRATVGRARRPRRALLRARKKATSRLLQLRRRLAPIARLQTDARTWTAMMGRINPTLTRSRRGPRALRPRRARPPSPKEAANAQLPRVSDATNQLPAQKSLERAQVLLPPLGLLRRPTRPRSSPFGGGISWSQRAEVRFDQTILSTWTKSLLMPMPRLVTVMHSTQAKKFWTP